MSGSRFLSCLLSLTVLFAPTASFAQGFSFDSPDESADAEEPADSDAADSAMGGDDADGGGISFDTSDIQAPSEDEQKATISVIALPGPDMSPDRRLKIENKMNEVLRDEVPNNNYVGADTIMGDLQSRGMLECVREPICLGAVGVNNKVDQILMARIVPTKGGGYTLSIDLFEAQDKLTLKYAKQEGLKTDAEILDAVKPLLQQVFDVRIARKTNLNQGNPYVSPIIAWSSLALALGSVGAGVYFTLAAKKGDESLKKDADEGTVTQVDAKSRNESVKNKQTISYVFYGLAAGLAAVSVVFFVLDVGGDISVDQESASIHNLRLSPVISYNGAGVSAGFNF